MPAIGTEKKKLLDIQVIPWKWIASKMVRVSIETEHFIARKWYSICLSEYTPWRFYKWHIQCGSRLWINVHIGRFKHIYRSIRSHKDKIHSLILFFSISSSFSLIQIWWWTCTKRSTGAKNKKKKKIYREDEHLMDNSKCLLYWFYHG